MRDSGLRIFYGQHSSYVDVTDDVLTFCCADGRIHIPGADVLRATIFGDPAVGVVKDVVVIAIVGEELTCRVFPDGEPVDLDAPDGLQRPRRPKPTVSGGPADDVIAALHEQLLFTGGSLTHELPEQRMAARFVRPDARVLELGSNIGRNTVIIASLLNDPANLVTLECGPGAVELLRCNRAANDLDFHIEPSALSYRPLVQCGWDTLPAEDAPPGWEPVPTITFGQLRYKYGIEFDTLVVDCEGALYYILSDNPAMLDGIGTVVLEADYPLVEHKRAVEAVFAGHGLRRVYSEPLPADAGVEFPDEIAASFFEVWTRGSGPVGD